MSFPLSLWDHSAAELCNFITFVGSSSPGDCMLQSSVKAWNPWAPLKRLLGWQSPSAEFYFRCLRKQEQQGAHISELHHRHTVQADGYLLSYTVHSPFLPNWYDSKPSLYESFIFVTPSQNCLLWKCNTQIYEYYHQWMVIIMQKY